jgi:hypothetical protein
MRSVRPAARVIESAMRLAKGRKEMAVYKRGRIWWIDFCDQKGNRVQEPSLSSNRRDAEKLLSILQADVVWGKYRFPCKITLEENLA